jgi:hypothetical protein
VTFGLKANPDDYIFVPLSPRSDNAAVYAQLLDKQKKYMQNHRKILLVGIIDALMTKAPKNQEEHKSFKELLKDQPAVYRVDCTC